MAHRRAQHLQRLAVRHEDERFVSPIFPAWRLRQQPLEPLIAGVRGVRLLTKVALVGSEGRGECRPGRQRATHAIDLLAARDSVPGRHASYSSLDGFSQLPLRLMVDRDRDTYPRRQASDVDAT